MSTKPKVLKQYPNSLGKVEITGWIGVLLILSAYAFVTFEIVVPEDMIYGLMNLFGAAGIIFSSYAKRDFQPIFLNIVWLIVAAIGLIRNTLAMGLL